MKSTRSTIFLLTTALLFVVCAAGAQSSGAQSPAVTTTPVTARIFSETLRVQGNVDSASIARVSPRIPGPIEAIFVKEGDAVEANKTRLFVIDPVKLEKNLEIRRQELTIARLAIKEKEARLKQAEADLEKSKQDANRSRLLWEDNSTSQDNYEKAMLKLKVSEATIEHIKTLIALDQEQLKKAELALVIAEKDFADSTVLAPISGRISQKLQEPGEMAAPGKPILLIKDPDNIEVSAYLPAEYYHRVEKDQTKVGIKSYSGAEIKTVVSFKSPEISPELRTFQIKCQVADPNKMLVPGALAEVTILLAEKNGLAVPAATILNRDNGKAIFRVEGNRARMIMVTTGLENSGFYEVTAVNQADSLKEGDQIISGGQHLINDGQQVQVQKHDSEAAK
ncbi:MAG TPA: efflux RND transporter periplasmic adaptor subunit [Candidatus Rifleibacterium sp.]|nr:efflux RND transporter periplasmic adaptor subunit [Candidatus Rifleibacterium sp.]